MKNVDYIVVGSGLAGVMFCNLLQSQNKSFIVIDDASQQSSIVAGGLYNPVVLKRFTSVWRSKEQLDLALPIYSALEKELNVRLDYKIPVYRLFASIEEQNNWFLASDKPELKEFINPEIEQLNNSAIKEEYGVGRVLQTGRIDTKTLIATFKERLRDNEQLLEATFDHDKLQLEDKIVWYKDIRSKHIVFAEGFGMIQNPYFNYLPLKGTKGELLIVHAPELKIEYVLKSGAFLIPLGEDTYIVGATYEWTDKTNTITQEAKEELLAKVKNFISCDFKVIDQVAAIRPTVIDRRPLVGRHLEHENMYVLNGLGTRGVMIAPYVAKQLFEFIESNKPLNKELDISRFN